MKVLRSVSRALLAPPSLSQAVTHLRSQPLPARCVSVAGDGGAALPRPSAPVTPPAPTAGGETDFVRLPSLEEPIPALNTQPYAHRAFMGLTGSFLHHAGWAGRLRALMPAHYSACEAMLGSPDALRRIMRHLEGNPLISAYGLTRGPNPRLPIEWDIWLDPEAPGDLTRARIVHGNREAGRVARCGDPQAVAALMRGEAPGTDVHAGMEPSTWLALFRRASRDTGGPDAPAGIVLDVKSAWSSAHDIAQFCAALRAEGVPVTRVLSFVFAQLDPAAATPQVYLRDTPEEVAEARRLGALPHGAAAMFNGGTLLRETRQGVEIDAEALERVRALQQEGNLRLSLFLQEDHISPAALRTLIDCVNTHPQVFREGLAYGGVSGIAEGTLTRGVGMD